MSLFQCVNFISHSGLPLTWKIECDALTDADWDGLARIAIENLPLFGSVEGVPRGGLKFAEALRPHVMWGPLLIVDDVFTTGKSMKDHRLGREAIGVVAFSRGVCPAWITPLFQMPPASSS